MDHATSRRDMVERQLREGGVRDGRVLAAMGTVPRDVFVPEELRGLAYADRPLRIGQGQTISQPFMVAVMLEAAGIAPADRVLEIGAGSGYDAAVIGQLAARVTAIERLPALAEAAHAALGVIGCGHVDIIEADGTQGWPEAAPYDAIIVSAGGPHVPAPLRDQLALGGRLVMPVGPCLGNQRLLRLTRGQDDTFHQDDLGPVAFVPLIGAFGWPDT